MKALSSTFATLLVSLSSLAAILPTSQAEMVNGREAEYAIALDPPSAFVTQARESLQSSLAEIKPARKNPPRTHLAKTGQFILWGDLFRTGECYALSELLPQSDPSGNYGIALSIWQNGSWRLRQLWKIPTTWRPPGWKSSGDDPLPKTPATEPFELRDLGGGATPELIVAGEVGKYFQGFYILRFIKKSETLRVVGYAMARPEVIEKYVILSTDSGRRSIWQRWQFCQWDGDNLRPVAYWHAETGYNENDPTFNEGGRYDATGSPDIVRIQYGKGQELDEIYELTRNEKPFGRLRVTSNDEKFLQSPNASEAETAWLFEKTTGLPRRLLPREDQSKPIPKFENHATVTIEGNPEAAKFFSPR